DSIALDKDGNPVVSSILATSPVVPGGIPPAIVAGQPQPPAVLLGTRQKGLWSQTPVTQESPIGPAQGSATEVVDSNGMALPSVVTSLAVDTAGKHHVIWSTPTGVFYTDDATGPTFAPP